MAGMVASVGAVSGSEVTVFLSMNALEHFVKDGKAQAKAEGRFGTLLESKNVPPFKDLFRQASELGDAKVYPCSMACDVLGVEREVELRRKEGQRDQGSLSLHFPLSNMRGIEIEPFAGVFAVKPAASAAMAALVGSSKLPAPFLREA